MLVVGLTGGIGSGKSTVAHLFSQFNIAVIDADHIAKTLTEPGQDAYQQIIEQLGSHLIKPNGQLDRAQIKQLIFQDPMAKQQLEAILHPLIYTQITHAISTVSSTYCIVAIPLLVEHLATYSTLIHRILVIDLPKTEQIARVKQRDNSSSSLIERIIQAQASRHSRLQVAHEVLLNEGSLLSLKAQVQRLHQHYLQLA
jgi:dephospho-CoA kinase